MARFAHDASNAHFALEDSGRECFSRDDCTREHRVFDNLKVYKAGVCRTPYSTKGKQDQKKVKSPEKTQTPVYAYCFAVVKDFPSPWKACAELGVNFRMGDKERLVSAGWLRKGHVVMWLKSAPIPEDVPNGLVFA